MVVKSVCVKTAGVCVCERRCVNGKFSIAGNMYLDSRQSISSLMGPPGGYPHLPTLSGAASPMTGQSVMMTYCYIYFLQ